MASSNSGDCAFEDDSCGWVNPEERDGLDDLNWERTEASKSEFRIPDHTTGTKDGYYMALSRNSVQVGTRPFKQSWLLISQRTLTIRERITVRLAGLQSNWIGFSQTRSNVAFVCTESTESKPGKL